MKHPLQAMFDGTRDDRQKTRAAQGWTLGDLIAGLEALDPALTIELSAPHSYRGYYEDLSFARVSVSVATALDLARGAMGEAFEGYKGGEYVMGRTTPVWLSDYGTTSGRRIVGLMPGDEYVVVVTEFDE